MKRLMLILWPSFLAAGAAELALFNVLDPSEFQLGRLATYSIVFFLFWALAACSSALTCFLQERPAARPKREPS